MAEKDELIRIVRLLGAKENLKSDKTLESFNQTTYDSIHPVANGLDRDVNMSEKINFLLSLDKCTRAQSDKIIQTDLNIAQRLQQVEIFNSHGLHVADNRHYSRLSALCIAQDGGEKTTGRASPGALKGWEFLKEKNPKEIAEEISKEALIKLSAKPCPAGNMPVIIDKGFGGVIFHEACGHLLETTSVAKKASVFHDKMDQMIANSAVSAVDDGTIKGQWGSVTIDDEGMPTEKTQLIKNGVLTSFLVDYVGGLKTGLKRTGSGRRQNYKFAPTSRMRNTYIEPGNYKLEEMIATIDEGIYCKKMGGGSVKPGTGEFNFNAEESYLIKNGKIHSPLKSATLIGTGPDILKKISMVGKELELSAGMCGSVSGAVPVTVGQSALKVDSILVGGDAI